MSLNKVNIASIVLDLRRAVPNSHLQQFCDGAKALANRSRVCSKSGKTGHNTLMVAMLRLMEAEMHKHNQSFSSGGLKVLGNPAL